MQKIIVKETPEGLYMKYPKSIESSLKYALDDFIPQGTQIIIVKKGAVIRCRNLCLYVDLPANRLVNFIEYVTLIQEGIDEFKNVLENGI